MRQEKVVFGIIKAADVVLCTNVGAASRLLHNALRRDQPNFTFDTVVIDEVQEALCALASRVVHVRR